MNLFRRVRDAAICVALLALPFFFLKTNLKFPEELGFFDRLIVRVSAPIQYVASQAAESASAWIERYTYLVEVKAENERYQQEIAHLRTDNARLRAQASEAQRLRDLLQLRDHVRGDTESAQVIGKDISPFFRVVRLRIDRGERHHVRPGMAVVSTQGLVGQVRRAWGRFSDVLLTVDRDSAVDVTVPRTGARGMLKGTGENDRYRCRIQFLEKSDEVKVGDEVYTSGLGQRFPASILVGTVSRVDHKGVGLYQEVEVSPTVNFSSLEEVLILSAGSREQSVAQGGRSSLSGRPQL